MRSQTTNQIASKVVDDYRGWFKDGCDVMLDQLLIRIEREISEFSRQAVQESLEEEAYNAAMSRTISMVIIYLTQDDFPARMRV